MRISDWSSDVCSSDLHLDDIATGRKVSIISEGNGSKLILLSHAPTPVAEVTILKGKSKISETFELNLAEFIDVKGLKAMGNRRSEEHTSELQSLMRSSYAVLCLNKKKEHKI